MCGGGEGREKSKRGRMTPLNALLLIIISIAPTCISFLSVCQMVNHELWLSDAQRVNRRLKEDQSGTSKRAIVFTATSIAAAAVYMIYFGNF